MKENDDVQFLAKIDYTSGWTIEHAWQLSNPMSHPFPKHSFDLSYIWIYNICNYIFDYM